MDNIDKLNETKSSNPQWLLLIATFIIATCGLIYELVAGTLASYLLGDSITQFSIIIGTYLFSMGVGSYLSKYFNGNLIAWFIKIEIIVGLIGGFSAPILFVLFPIVSSFKLVLYTFVFFTGMLVGLEIPLLMRILQNKVAFKDLVSKVFTVDYIGALLASLVFPLILVPYLGIIRTSLLFGILNIAIGLYLLHTFKKDIKNHRQIQFSALVILFAEVIAFAASAAIMSWSETLAYNDTIVYATSTPYQRIVLTKNKRELRLFLNNNLQFSSADEYRYHEALVHPAITASNKPKNILVLGGGDGLAVREILKYPFINHITLVDLDPTMTKLFSSQAVLTAQNNHSLTNSKVSVINADAFIWMKNNKLLFDCIIIDFPDPSNFNVGKLYTTAFYSLLKKSMTNTAFAVIQSTSPFAAPKSFWCVNETLKSVGFRTQAYHNYVPSFGEWGYILASQTNYQLPDTFEVPLKFLSRNTMKQMINFPQDMTTTEKLDVNRLNNQALVNYFEEEWGKFLSQ